MCRHCSAALPKTAQAELGQAVPQLTTLKQEEKTDGRRKKSKRKVPLVESLVAPKIKED
jgi:hypothetical protein